MPDKPVTCLVTLHGIGFQQPPSPGQPGYADALHQHLSSVLGPDVLYDDKRRQDDRTHPGEAGPIYVRSHWPPGSQGTEPGLARLGRIDESGQVHADGWELSDGDHPLAHVALVYSFLEGHQAQVGPLGEIVLRSISSLQHYTSIAGLVRLGLQDGLALFHHGQGGHTTPTPSLQVRSDLPRARGKRPSTQPPTGLLATVRQLENDVAAYVTDNDLRERVRSFVRDALVRLAGREDVGGIVLNTHSQGTVVAYDVVRSLPPSVANRITSFITAGSPLRKYVDLFGWGRDVGCIYAVGDAGSWTNFWDASDPVADSLDAPLDWHWGSDPTRPSGQPGLFQAVDPNTGALLPFAIDDRGLDNLQHSSGGGLQAHNYWDNEPQFVAPLADLLRQAAGI